jgi:hypothetical protein
MSNGPTLAEVDQGIAALRENLRQLTEQAAADSSAAHEDLNAERIAEQEQELARLLKLRETLARG